MSPSKRPSKSSKAARGRKRPEDEPLPVIGWREWLALPGLGIERVKAKIDTGARTSSLHAFDLERFEVEGQPWVRFRIHPLQRDTTTTVEVEAPLSDERSVKPSTGQARLRPVILTRAVLGGWSWPIEITLVNRDVMGFRMLLGRRAFRRRFMIDPGRSFLAGQPRS
jgi:hypothetical protein